MRTVNILTNKQEMTYTGEKFQGDGYYGFNDGIHTVSFNLKNFTGRIYVQATLMEDPSEDDWFDIELTHMHAYLEFNQDTTNRGVTFTGNFVWIRLKVDRAHIANQVYDIDTHGSIEKAVLAI
jgi:hypothetical protein